MNRLNEMFKLPPVSERKWPEELIHKFLNRNFRKEFDDTYIYYLIFRLGFFIALGFALLFLSSYFLNTSYDLYFITVEVAEPDVLGDVAWNYPVIVVPTLLIVMGIYAELLFRANIDINKLDLLNWNVDFLNYSGGDRRKVLNRSRGGLILFFTAAFGVFALPIMITRYYDVNGISFTFFSLLFASYIISFSSLFIIFLFSLRYQYKRRLGPRFNSSPHKQEN